MFEVKVVPVHNMKAYRWRRDKVPLMLNHGTIYRRVVNFTPRPLYPRYPLNRRLVWLPSRSDRFVDYKSYVPLPGQEAWAMQRDYATPGHR